MSSVSKWLESRNYGDLVQCFEDKYPHHSYFSSMHPCVDIRISDEKMDATVIQRLLKTGDGGFSILRAICGNDVRANRLIELMEDLKKEVYIYFASQTPSQ